MLESHLHVSVIFCMYKVVKLVMADSGDFIVFSFSIRLYVMCSAVTFVKQHSWAIVDKS